MGLDIHALVYGEAHYSRSYSGFGRVRKAIAAAAGFNLDEMVGFNGDRDWSTIPDAARGLIPLLNHSDCDGGMTSDECDEVADTLDTLLPKIDPEERDDAARLLAVLRAGAEGEGLAFH